MNSSRKRNYVLSRVISKHLLFCSTEVFRQQSQQEVMMYIAFPTPGHVWHPAPFPIQVPLAPCLSQGTGAKAIISSCKGNWNHLPLWEFLSSCYLNVGCIAGGTGELLLVLVFAFNLWACLMEAQHGNTECKALLTGIWLKKVEMCATGLCSQWKMPPKTSCCLSTVKKFRLDICNTGTVTCINSYQLPITNSNWCTKQYAVLWQSIIRIFYPGTVTVTTNQYFLPFRTATHEPSVWMQ